MKNLKKKIAALGVGLAVMASSAMSMSASAWEPDPWPSYYTPNAGYFYADKDVFLVREMKWTASQLSSITNAHPILTPLKSLGIEFEFRPTNYTPSQIWAGENTDLISNMPGPYAETDDPNDVTIGCGQVAGLEAEKSYYGIQYMTAQTGAPSAAYYNFEVELGFWVIGASNILQDRMPIRGATYTNYSTYLGRTYNMAG